MPRDTVAIGGREIDSVLARSVHVTDVRVLVVDDESGRTLTTTGGAVPVLRFDAFPPLDGRLCDALVDQIGIRALIRDPIDFTTVMLAASPGQPAPDGFRWRVRDDDRADHWRPAWFGPGWYDAADAYIDRVLDGRGWRRTGGVRQIKHWSLSVVLRIPTDHGDVYLKSGLPPFAHEPALTSWLGTLGVGSFATIIDHSHDGWLAEDFSRRGAREPEPADARSIITALTTVQHAVADRVDIPLTLGCRRRSAADLAAGLDALFARTDLWEAPPAPANLGRALTGDEAQALRRISGEVADECAIVEDAGRPDTLLHGDLHPGNVVMRDDGVLLHDWSLATIGPSVLDLSHWYHEDTPTSVEARLYSGTRWPTRALRAGRPVSALYELTKFVELADLVGPAYAYNFLPVIYGWARKLTAAAPSRPSRRS